MYRLHFKKQVLKTLAKMPRKMRQRLMDALRSIAQDSAAYRGDWKPLSDSRYWRLRVGNRRAICEIKDDQLILLVLKVGTRGDDYK
ncbi:MAG: type II toxin-antitoxin system RelE/ParE family toxin [Thermoanaerobaculales bacterium]|nr:type II toxin-antitoxin system RelE/ParE family toxin [Thermoanaerobaculales bacterium]